MLRVSCNRGDARNEGFFSTWKLGALIVGYNSIKKTAYLKEKAKQDMKGDLFTNNTST